MVSEYPSQHSEGENLATFGRGLESAWSGAHLYEITLHVGCTWAIVYIPGVTPLVGDHSYDVQAKKTSTRIVQMITRE